MFGRKKPTRIHGNLWTFVGFSANMKSPTSLCTFSALHPPPLPICTGVFNPSGALHPLDSCFDLKPKGSLPTDFIGLQASSQFTFHSLLQVLQIPTMLLVQVPTSPNYKSPLNFALIWVATSHHLFILWHSRYLHFQILPHQFRINARCLVALYLLSKFLTKGYTKKVLKSEGTWPGTGLVLQDPTLAFPLPNYALKCLSKQSITGATTTTSSHHKQLVITC